MRKILAALSVVSLASAGATTVISCSSNVLYKQFLQWIENKESFVLYIGAKDCDYCQKFEANIDYNQSYFNDKLSQISGEYNNSISKYNGNDDSFTSYGQKLNNDLNLRSFIAEEKSNNFKEKWSENIIKWLVDKVAEIYYSAMLDIGHNETIQKKVAKDKVKEYFNKIKGTPMFIIIRNGKIVDWEVGFEDDSTGWTENSLESLVKKISDSILNSEIESVLVDKVNTGSSETESGGESGGNGGESSGGESGGNGGESSGGESSGGESGSQVNSKTSFDDLTVNYQFDSIFNNLI
ncbi:hypothetical protein [Spiroplasma turonicum]|uniref:Lipoprotein n=1 Tax=Spiroplasma turonicum TaxID=216946 RepID=A0A0K1P5D3_9MOLU|nr:hypothetical protein [Spiroplasma turonicum]AKU79506.1 hypothetical protein STURON_00260 [Spiroplasma turonicum]ALX70528.1 hypothetical protein STURO_v1c02600 [Spiroplasma turonicum]